MSFSTPAMEALVILVVALTVSGVAGFVLWLRHGVLEGIPQPPGNYVFGHVFQLGGHMGKLFMEWKKSVGPVFQIRIFNTPLVVFNNRESIVRVCGMPEASGRPQNGFLQLLSEILGDGVATLEGAMWEGQRQFYQKAFRTFGIGRTATEQRVLAEIQLSLQEWENLNGAPFELEGCSTKFAVNAVWGVTASKRLDAAQVSYLVHNFQRTLKMDTISQKVSAISVSFANSIPLFRIALEEKIDGFRAIATVARLTTDEHCTTRRRKEPRDVIDMVLDEVDETVDVTSPFHAEKAHTGFGISHILLASIDSTSGSIEWIMLHLAQNPTATLKMQAEIDRVLGDGTDCYPTLSDRESMPYTQACILEGLRIGSIGPLGMPRRAIADLHFNGRVIPKGTVLVMNMYAAHYDPEAWDRPQEFKPERFLTTKGNQIDIGVRNRIMSFGVGRRMCPGYQIAMDAIFLFVANSYRKFTFELSGSNSVAQEGFGLGMFPPRGISFRAIIRRGK